MTLISIVFVSYLLLVMIVGGIASRYGRTMEGYFLADRGLGSWVTAIKARATPTPPCASLATTVTS